MSGLGVNWSNVSRLSISQSVVWTDISRPVLDVVWPEAPGATAGASATAQPVAGYIGQDQGQAHSDSLSTAWNIAIMKCLVSWQLDKGFQ